MGIITDEMRLQRTNRLNAEALSIQGNTPETPAKRQELARLLERIPGCGNRLLEAMAKEYDSKGIVASCSIGYQSHDLEVRLLDNPVLVREIEYWLRVREPNTLHVEVRRCKYTRATRTQPDKRPAMEIVATFYPHLT